MKRLIIILALSLLGMSIASAQEAPTEPGVAAPVPAPAAPAGPDPQAAFAQAMEILEGNPYPTDATLDVVFPLLDAAYKGGVDRTEVPYNLGVIACRRGKLAEAVRLFKDARVLDPSNADIVAMLGRIAARQGRGADAEALIQEALAIDEYSSVALNYLADKENQARNYEQALVYCRKGLLGNPDNLDSYLNMGIVYYETDRLELGELVCQSAFKLNKETASMRNLLGLIYLKQNEVRKASKEFERAVKADPDYMDARKNLASLVLNYKDFESAVTFFEEVLMRDPDNMRMRLSYAVALRGVDKFDAAKTELEGILAKQPGNLEAGYNLCILLHEYLETYEDALKQCADFQARIDKRHGKWREMSQRVKGIKETIEVLKEFPEDKPTPDDPSGKPATEAPEAPADPSREPATEEPADPSREPATEEPADPSREPATEAPTNGGNE